MASTILTPSMSVKRGILIINALDDSKFSLILGRILKSLPVKEKTFNELEEVKLQTSLNLSAHDVTLLLETLDYILKQAAYHLVRPCVLSQELFQLNMTEDKVTILIEAWSGSAKLVVGELSQQSLAPVLLEDVNWRLHLKMSQATKAKTGQPIAVFDFGLHDQGSHSKKNVLVEFTHSDMYAFYNQLDAIQTQLDSFR